MAGGPFGGEISVNKDIPVAMANKKWASRRVSDGQSGEMGPVTRETPPEELAELPPCCSRYIAVAWLFGTFCFFDDYNWSQRGSDMTAAD
jgi:hypothetical protein